MYVCRSNSSILGQRKKNQRKLRNKKRAHDRKMSESENSETEERDKFKLANNVKKCSQDETTTTDAKVKSILQVKNLEDCKSECKNDLIFHLDLDLDV